MFLMQLVTRVNARIDCFVRGWLVVVKNVLLLLEDTVLLCEGGELLQPLLQQDGGHGHLPGVRGDPDLTGVGQTGGTGGQS